MVIEVELDGYLEFILDVKHQPFTTVYWMDNLTYIINVVTDRNMLNIIRR